MGGDDDAADAGIAVAQLDYLQATAAEMLQQQLLEYVSVCTLDALKRK